MIAEVISVGTELLLGQTVDTDAVYVAKALPPLGISIYHRSTVGDNVDRLKDVLRLAFSRADLIITIGGLGPTMDDLTKETVAEVLGVPMIEDPAHSEWLRHLAESRGWQHPPASFVKQALAPALGRGLPNPVGTALGALFEKDGKIAVCLPGPPNELMPMVDEQVIPYLMEKFSGSRSLIKSRTLRIIGIGESSLENKVKDLMTGTNPTVAPYAKTGEVHLRVTARAANDAEADSLILPMVEKLEARLGDMIYGYDGQSLESVVVALLRGQGKTVAAAESCSGGLISKRITDVPNASTVFGLGVVAYANEAKAAQLGVPLEMIAVHGAVSPEVAVAMARGVRAAAGADIGVSVTGIAGPDGGTPEKPVGTVHIGLSFEGADMSEHQLFLGRRQDIAHRSSQSALALVRRALLHPELFSGRNNDRA